MRERLDRYNMRIRFGFTMLKSVSCFVDFYPSSHGALCTTVPQPHTRHTNIVARAMTDREFARPLSRGKEEIYRREIKSHWGGIPKVLGKGQRFVESSMLCSEIKCNTCVYFEIVRATHNAMAPESSSRSSIRKLSPKTTIACGFAMKCLWYTPHSSEDVIINKGTWQEYTGGWQPGKTDISPRRRSSCLSSFCNVNCARYWCKKRELPPQLMSTTWRASIFWNA